MVHVPMQKLFFITNLPCDLFTRVTSVTPKPRAALHYKTNM